MEIAIGLTFPGVLKDEAVISYLCKNFEINLKIIEASFSTSSGWAFLKIEGKEKEIQRVFEYLADKGVQIQQIDSKDK